ncbi:hypothetical protein MKW98_030830 [Papaver atlanticum]|uniref:Uncharacterized protein n=1 Tax=Papaver atlanticum TaxID=357466 RepID=A0AAD4S258_9MAGN|nr:hypothetical protein MKW98_030830 [Papaver atlanticum]
MNGIRHEVLNYRHISMRIDSMVEYFDSELEQSTVFSSIPAIVQSISSSLATKNLKAMDKIEKQYFDKEVVAKFKYSAATFISEETKSQSWRPFSPHKLLFARAALF